MKSILIVFALVTGLFAAQARAVTFETDSLTIVKPGGQRYTFTVELALTREQQAQGLMFREKLPIDEGMLFVFPQEREASFWMKNTLIPLDMLFVAGSGEIIHIHPMAEPESTRSISSRGIVRGVVELAGGTAAMLGIRPGAIVEHAAFGR